jgi:hypothetical protein
MRRLIATHLSPQAPGSKESDVLWAALTHGDALRGEYARMLVSSEGQEAWLQAEGVESEFHVWLGEHASLVMKQLLMAIRAFERMARLMTDAFDEVRWRMTQERAPVDVTWLGQGPAVKLAKENFIAAYGDAVNELGEIDPVLRMRAERAFVHLCEAVTPTAFAAQLLEHHAGIQRAKPPNGKRAWFDTFGDGRVAIRPAYTVDNFAAAPEKYVHTYRARPLSSFALKLGRITPSDGEA